MDLNKTRIDALSRAVLYEGHSLFPYTRTAVKNAKSLPFGVVYPREYSEHHPEVGGAMQTECLVRGGPDLCLQVTVRFLQRSGLTDTEVVEREVVSDSVPLVVLATGGVGLPIQFPYLDGTVTFEAREIGALRDVFRVLVRIVNSTPVPDPASRSRDDMFPRSFLSTHTILTVHGGKFLSVLEPAPEWKSAAEACQNFGTWPVLVGDDDRTVLSSPIILYDHPQVAEESTGDLFDATEIEEALLLHLSVLPDAEKQEIAGSDEKLRQMLARAESITPELMRKLHGACREVPKPKEPL
jgi:hypothetical protein